MLEPRSAIASVLAAWGRLPIPVPANYLLGIDRQKYDFDEAGFRSYLRGRWRQGGWWYYYLYAIRGVPGNCTDSMVLASGIRMSGIPLWKYAPRRCAGMTIASYSGEMCEQTVHRNARENPVSLGIKPTVDFVFKGLRE